MDRRNVMLVGILAAGLCGRADTGPDENEVIVITQPERPVHEIAEIYAEMPPLEYRPPDDRWVNLPRTAAILRKGAGELRIKESDRIITTIRELSRLGAKIEELPDGMIIYGGKVLSGTEVRSHSDHRLAMSLAVAGLIAEGNTLIKDSRVAEVSNPHFWEELGRLSRY